MLFNSLVFVLFNFLICFFYWASPSLKIRKFVLVVGSCIFYSWAYWPGLFLFMASATFNYWGALLVDRHKSRRLLISCIFVNLLNLGYFKYSSFLFEIIKDSFLLFGLSVPLPELNYWLPLGISFYTFQMIAYLVDVYRGDVKKETDLLDFLVFISFYAQLVAGPIVRAKDLLPQIKKKQAFKFEVFYQGFYYVLAGLFIKVVIADSVAQFVDYGFDNPQTLSLYNSWATLYGFAVQILADFWGYSTIAVGVGYLFGYKLPINFNNPYVASSAGDFWRRWHVTLSTWLRDYLYFPLGGSRTKVYRNLFITLSLTGLWHGASWNFVIYGSCHGVWMVLERYFRGSAFALLTPRWLKQFLVFQGLSVLRILFRAPDLNTAYLFFIALFGVYKSSVEVSDTLLGLMGLFVVFLIFFEKSLRDDSFLHWSWRKQCLVSLTFLCMILSYASARIDFIYFEF